MPSSIILDLLLIFEFLSLFFSLFLLLWFQLAYDGHLKLYDPAGFFQDSLAGFTVRCRLPLRGKLT